MDVYHNGQPVPESDLLTHLTEIKNSSQTKEFPVGILTSDGRTQWAHARQKLMKGWIVLILQWDHTYWTK